MSDRVFYCPECRRVFSDTRRPPTGQLFQCPGCKLLFVPIDKDFAGGVGPREYETKWAEAGEGANPTAPYSAAVPKRLRRLAQRRDLMLIYLSATLMLIVGGVILLIARHAHSTIATAGRQPDSQIAKRQAPESQTVDAGTEPERRDSPAPKPANASGSALLGEWTCTDQPLEGVADAPIVALQLAAQGAATVTSRSGVEIESSTGRWRHSGSTLLLALGPRETPLTVEFLDDDRIRVTSPRSGTSEFKRRKGEP